MNFSICIITNAGLDVHARRRVYLKRLLASLPNAGFSKENSEVIIAGALFEDLQCDHALSLTNLAESKQVSALRNLAIAKASGDWIVQCDDDLLFSPGYVENISESLNGMADIICTRLLNPNGTRYWDWAAYIPTKGQTLLPYDTEDSNVYATGGHAIYRKALFSKIQWPESMRHGENEEFKVAALAREHGFRFGFCKKALVFLQYHHCDALAAIGSRPKKSSNENCREFEKLITALDATKHSSTSIKNPAIQIDPIEILDLRERLGHKLTVTAVSVRKGIDVSILTCCNRYLQRFRLYAQSICRQDYDLSRVEVIVANPESPDGLGVYLESLRLAYPAPRFENVLVDAIHWRNRGFLIQAAFERSEGKIVIGMDCDLILPSYFIRRIVETIQLNPMRVVGVYRNFLTAQTTAEILTSRLDPFSNFDVLQNEDHEEERGFRGVLGYCQATTREAWERTGYPIEYDEIAKSDVAFIEQLGKIHVTPLFISDLKVLHLNHARNWMGTDKFL